MRRRQYGANNIANDASPMMRRLSNDAAPTMRRQQFGADDIADDAPPMMCRL